MKHSTLLRIMREQNFSDKFISWFYSYLTGRSQAIIDLRGFLTDFIKLTSGIPQGSNPGPIAFLILINSIIKCLKYCNNSCLLFADDFQIYLQCKRQDLHKFITILNEDALNVADWADNHDLSINFNKVLAIIIASDQMLKRIKIQDLPRLVIRGH